MRAFDSQRTRQASLVTARTVDGLYVRAVNRGGLFLEVRNEQAPDIFIAEIELVDGLESVFSLSEPIDPRKYRGVWVASGTPASLLGRGEKDQIWIGRIEIGPDHMPAARRFRVAFFDEARQVLSEYGSTGWLDSTANVVPPRLELRVTISSVGADPMRSYCNNFVLDADDPKVLRDEKPFTTGFTGIRVGHF
jgi:hypothetical protein